MRYQLFILASLKLQVKTTTTTAMGAPIISLTNVQQPQSYSNFSFLQKDVLLVTFMQLGTTIAAYLNRESL